MHINLNIRIFSLPFLALVLAIAFSLIDAEYLVEQLDSVRSWMLSYFDWLFNWTVFGFVITALFIYISPIGRVTLGGKEAIPIFSKTRWLAIVICTTVATGILFWGSAEPLYHLYDPPSSTLTPGSEASAVTAMSTLYMHWTISPYALYTMVSLAFALAFYHYKLPFRVSSIIRIGVTDSDLRWYHDLVDSFCLFALVAGMAASLGAGVLTISGGLDDVLGLTQDPVLWALIVVSIAAAFVLSSASGLKKGIKWLSLINIVFFIIMIIIMGLMLMSHDAWILSFKGLSDYVIQFVPRSLGFSNFDRSWEQSWTSFYWANWMAWAPVTALFLGRIARGRTVREFIRYNLVYTSLFSMLWMTIFGSIAISKDRIEDGGLFNILDNGGPQDVIFKLINELSLGDVGSVIFLIIVYISYVTAADSNTSAMSGLSSVNLDSNQPEAPLSIKLFWGFIIAAMSWVMISFAGLEGIRILSIIGGFPILFLCIYIVFLFMRMIFQRKL